VELHGGTVTATNNAPDAGATFRVALPALASVEPRSDLAASTEEDVIAAAPMRASQLDGLSVLVVDDHLHTRELIATVLENAGADVRAAASAEDALMVLQTWQPQVMVSDIEMQGQDGYELMQSVRSLAGNRQRLIAVALTAHARPEDRLRAIEAGFQWHLTKPIDPSELVGVIASLMAQAGEVSSPA
jgi:CheY-like chemotaxis protein